MGFQCVPQSIGLVRELKTGQKNRSVGKPILKESGEERASKSTTRDRTRSHENVYEGYRRGEACWEAMVADADEYRSEYTTKSGKQCSRRLPKHAIIGVQVIVNPPSEVADTWSRQTHFKFQKDAAEVLEEIEPRLFRADNVMMRAHHFDEGKKDRAADTHTVYIAKDENGHYCGSIYDANLRQRMAKEFAEKMRSRGWNIDNPELTDWERYEKDPEYKKHIDNKRKKQGKSQPEYDAQKQAERKLKDTQEQTRSAIAERDAALIERNKAQKQREIAEESRKLIAGKSFKRGGLVLLGVEGLEEKRSELIDAVEVKKGELESLNTQLTTGKEELKLIQAREEAVKDRESNLEAQEQDLLKRKKRVNERFEAKEQAFLKREKQANALFEQAEHWLSAARDFHNQIKEYLEWVKGWASEEMQKTLQHAFMVQKQDAQMLKENYEGIEQARIYEPIKFDDDPDEEQDSEEEYGY